MCVKHSNILRNIAGAVISIISASRTFLNYMARRVARITGNSCSLRTISDIISDQTLANRGDIIELN